MTKSRRHNRTTARRHLVLGHSDRYYGGEVKTYVAIVTSFLLFTVALRGEVFPQQNSQESTHVVISPTSGLPGQEISLPIYLEAASGVEVGSIALDLVFPNQLISFVMVQGSLVSEMVGAQITAEVRADAKDESKSVLKVTLSTLDTGSRQAIPDGLLGFVTVHLAEDAQLDSQIVLTSRGSAMTTGPSPRPVDALTIHDGVISVGEVAFACFFYMH